MRRTLPFYGRLIWQRHVKEIRESANAPFVILAENGALQINVITGSYVQDEKVLTSPLLAPLKGSFERQVIRLIEKEVFPRYALGWSETADDQAERLWIPAKRTMVTINIPKTFRNGRDYRSSVHSETLRRILLDCMVQTASMLSLRYEIL